MAIKVVKMSQINPILEEYTRFLKKKVFKSNNEKLNPNCLRRQNNLEELRYLKSKSTLCIV